MSKILLHDKTLPFGCPCCSDPVLTLFGSCALPLVESRSTQTLDLVLGEDGSRALTVEPQYSPRFAGVDRWRVSLGDSYGYAHESMWPYGATISIMDIPSGHKTIRVEGLSAAGAVLFASQTALGNNSNHQELVLALDANLGRPLARWAFEGGNPANELSNGYGGEDWNIADAGAATFDGSAGKGGGTAVFSYFGGSQKGMLLMPPSGKLLLPERFTFAAWLVLFNNGSAQALFSNTTSTGNALTISLVPSTPDARLSVQLHDFAVQSGSFPYTTSDPADVSWPANVVWVHVIVAVDRTTGNVRFFRNGASLPSAVVAGSYNTMPLFSGPFMLGAKPDNVAGGTITTSSLVFTGGMDEVRLYADFLTDTQAMALYRAMGGN